MCCVCKRRNYRIIPWTSVLTCIDLPQDDAYFLFMCAQSRESRFTSTTATNTSTTTARYHGRYSMFIDALQTA